MAQWENLKTDGERIRWLSENLSAVMGMLHRETEQINALQQRVQVLEEEIEKMIGLPLGMFRSVFSRRQLMPLLWSCN